MVNLICQCGHKDNSHTENGCNFPTCSCDGFIDPTQYDEPKGMGALRILRAERAGRTGQ
jgi:hypothetical protein